MKFLNPIRCLMPSAVLLLVGAAVVPLLFAQAPPSLDGQEGCLRFERWDGISGGTLAALFNSAAFKEAPTVDALVSEAAITPNAADNYGARLRGTVRVPYAGTYRFYVASDDQGQLWLGTPPPPAGGLPASSKFTRQLAAYVSGYTAPNAWTANVQQASPVFTLNAGQEIYLEAVMKENGGGDHLSIAWTYTPTDTAIAAQTTPALIPGRMTVGGVDTWILKSAVPDPLDADADGLLDEWEMAAGLDPSDNGSDDPADGAYSDPDNDGFTNYQEWLAGGDPFASGGVPGHVQRDIWTGITGGTLASLTSSTAFPKPANSSAFVASDLNFPSRGDSYGQRVRGLVVPPISGTWRFWIAGDDQCELWVSDTWKATGKRKAAYVSSWTNANAFDTTPSQKSLAFALATNAPRYFEILHKEGTGGDHVSVAWAFEPVNWALAAQGSVASQSTTYGGQDASRAIDGNTSGAIPSTTLSHTNSTADSWWQVEFRQDGQAVNRPVNRVVIFNRTDATQNQQRLSNFRITLTNKAGAVVKTGDFHTASGYVQGSETWDVGETVEASKVRIQFLGYNLMGNGYLCLAEIQAFEWVPEATRHIVPAASLRTAMPDPDDADGDSLPDGWEAKFAISYLDNGATVQANGEYGDPDGDTIPNLTEYHNQSPANAPNGTAGVLQRDTWWNLPGGSLSDLLTAPAFLDLPVNSDTATAWQTGGRGDYYGQRLRGLYQAQATGWHTFWVAGDNCCALYLNDGSYATGPNAALNASARKFGKRLIASVGGEYYHVGAPYAGPTEFDKYPSQRSVPVYLEVGNSYFLEILHKEDYSTDFLTAAVQAPGGTREYIPFTSLTSFAYEADDGDNDDLPDSWESANSLDPRDNGRFDPVTQGASGDADGDQLTNREEYLLGTSPTNPDSDGDGLGDYVETQSLGSDATPGGAASGINTAVPLQDLAGSDATGVSGQWVAGPNESLLSLTRRGTARWNFTLNAAGYRVLELLATPQGNTWAGAPLQVAIAIIRTGAPAQRWELGTFPLRDDEGNPTRVLTLLPWLNAGTYQAEVALKNISESRNIRLDRLRILEPTGLGSNGTPNWVTNRLTEENDFCSPTAVSPVSPACVEGFARDVAKTVLTTTTQTVTPSAGVANWWFAALDLPDDGTAMVVTGAFENGALQRSQVITWTSTNALGQGATVTIRKGDSLRLTAYPGTDMDTGAVIITGAGSRSAPPPICRSFARSPLPAHSLSTPPTPTRVISKAPATFWSRSSTPISGRRCPSAASGGATGPCPPASLPICPWSGTMPGSVSLN